MNNFFTIAFVAYGGWLSYMSVGSFLTQMPISGMSLLASALLAFAASYCVRRRKWRILLVVFLILYTVVDLSAVFFHTQQ